MLVIVDSNVWISALWGSVHARQIVGCWLDGRFELVVCQELYDELAACRHRRKLSHRIHSEDLVELLKKIKTLARWETPALPPLHSRDPRDDYLLGLCAATSADDLVTGDQDLLVLGTCGQTHIVTPTEFLRTSP